MWRHRNGVESVVDETHVGWAGGADGADDELHETLAVLSSGCDVDHNAGRWGALVWWLMEGDYSFHGGACDEQDVVEEGDDPCDDDMPVEACCEARTCLSSFFRPN